MKVQAYPDGQASSRTRARATPSATPSSAALRPVVANMVRDKLGYKYHYAIADYLQRSARHIASATTSKQAYAVGKAAAVEFAVQGKTAVMPVIKRVSDKPYKWTIESAPLAHRQQGKDGAQALHHEGRLRHHGSLPALPRAADQAARIILRTLNGLPQVTRSSKERAVKPRLGKTNLWYDARAFVTGLRTISPYNRAVGKHQKRQISFG